MQSSTERSTRMDIKYIGMDVHKEAIAIAVMNGEGKLVMESIHSGPVEEGSTFRRQTIETASSLSVSNQESVPSLGDHPWRWQSGFFLRRSGRGRVSSQKLGDVCDLARAKRIP